VHALRATLQRAKTPRIFRGFIVEVMGIVLKEDMAVWPVDAALCCSAAHQGPLSSLAGFGGTLVVALKEELEI
jgi:hypothetical protein